MYRDARKEREELEFGVSFVSRSASPCIQSGSPFERTVLHYSQVPLRQSQLYRGLTYGHTEQKPACEDFSLTLRQGLNEPPDTLGWPAVYPKRVTFRRTFPACFLQHVQRTAQLSRAGPPVVNERSPRHARQPVV